MTTPIIVAIVAAGLAVLAVLALALWPIRTDLPPIRPNELPGGGILGGILTGLV